MSCQSLQVVPRMRLCACASNATKLEHLHTHACIQPKLELMHECMEPKLEHSPGARRKTTYTHSIRTDDSSHSLKTCATTGGALEASEGDKAVLESPLYAAALVGDVRAASQLIQSLSKDGLTPLPRAFPLLLHCGMMSGSWGMVSILVDFAASLAGDLLRSVDGAPALGCSACPPFNLLTYVEGALCLVAG
jgi:hypothetical protein